MAKRRQEFEGIEHVDVVRESVRRERRRSITERIRDMHNEPDEVFKPYFAAAILCLVFSWAPFWPEMITFITGMMALSHTRYGRRLWGAPHRVPHMLGKLGFKDITTGKLGDGTIYHGVARGAYAGQEIWSSGKDIETHRLIIGTTGSGKTEEILGMVFNSLSVNSGAIFVDGKASADTLNSLKRICRVFGRDEDFLVLCFMMGSRDSQSFSEVKLTNTFNPFAAGSANQKATLMETFLPKVEGGNSVFAERAMEFNKALPLALNFLQSRGYVDYSPRLMTEFYQLDNLENLVWFGRFKNKHGEIVDLAQNGPARDFLQLKQACRPLEHLLMGLPGYATVLPKTAPNLVETFENQIADALLGGEEAVDRLAKEMFASYLKTANSESEGGSKDGNPSASQTAAAATRAEIYRQWGYIVMGLSGPAALLTYTYGHVFNAEIGELNMTDVFLNRRIVFVMIPSLEKAPPSTAALGKITVATVKQVLANLLQTTLEGNRRELVDASPTRSKMPFTMIFDEYGYYAVEGFSVTAAQARSFSVSNNYGMQTPDSLEKAGAQEASEIIQNTTLRHVGRFKGGEDDKTFQMIRGWGGKQMISASRGVDVDTHAAFRTTERSKELQYQEEFVIKLGDLTGQENGQFHMIVSLQQHEGSRRVGENRTIRYKAFYTGDVPDVMEWRFNHFIPVKQRNDDSINAIRARDALERMLEESSATDVRAWSLNQGDPQSQFEDHGAGDAIATLLRGLATVIASQASDNLRQKMGVLTSDRSSTDFARAVQIAHDSGEISAADWDAAMRVTLSDLDKKGGEHAIKRDVNNLHDAVTAAYSEVVKSWKLEPTGEKVALAAFDEIITPALRKTTRIGMRNVNIAKVTDAAVAALAAE